jgi:hypothetical protein
MAKPKTIITTFGYSHGEPPQADLVYDARQVAHHDLDAWEQAASDLAEQIKAEPGIDVAIGCEDGDDRSVHIARFVQKLVPDVVVVDRDLQPGAGGNPMPKSDMKGSEAVMSENIRSLKRKGMSEMDAIAHTINQSGRDDDA